jgi:Domain of unknown function (DUF4157)/L,D-transpeptidase catalytic domain
MRAALARTTPSAHAVTNASLASRARDLSPTRPRIQTKLTVGPVDDPLEREADHVAYAVASGQGTPSTIQRKCAACEDDEARVMRKLAGPDRSNTILLQRQPLDEPGEAELDDLDVEADALLEDEPEPDASGMPKLQDGRRAPTVSGLATPLSGHGEPLAPPVRAFAERGLGRRLGEVRIHRDAEAIAATEAFGARAFTVGRDVYFNRDEYRPFMRDGQRLLLHELVHVVQQSGNSLEARVQCAPRRRRAPDTPRTPRRRRSGACPQGKQRRVVRDDCSRGGPADRDRFISNLEVSIGSRQVTATWSSGSPRTQTWECSANDRHTPRGDDTVGIKCSIDHTNLKRDGMAWFTGFAGHGYAIGFHDSQPVGPGFQSHGCVRVRCPVAETINRHTWSGRTTIHVA